MLQCVKGDTAWTHYFQNPFYASPIIADEKVYLLDRAGIMHIVNAEGKFTHIAESPLGEALIARLHFPIRGFI